MASADITTVADKSTAGFGSHPSFELDPSGAAGTYTDICTIREIPEIMSEGELIQDTSICQTSHTYVDGISDGSELTILAKDVPADADHAALIAAAQARETRKMKITYKNGRTCIVNLKFTGFGMQAATTGEVLMCAMKAKISGDLVWGLVA